jgi:putative mRNA 3-end processing factor
MKLSYQHANPSTGGGSYLLRFRNEPEERTACVLVDSGVGVDLDALLGEDEYLAAVLLTHAHLDHYASLSDSIRHGAPVYAADPTANVLEHVLVEGEKNYEIGASDGVVDALEPTDGWTTLVPGVEAAPIPAGHTPGAASFLVRFEDGTRTNTLLFTGDFTTRQVAGFPGISTDLPTGVDGLFVNVSTEDEFEETLSDSLFTIAERARAGSPALVTASGLTGVHYAYLLGHLGERFDESLPVTLVGQAAKLYADFGYDVPNVELVPVFDDPTELVERGTVTIAGPEVPKEGGARRLFRQIEDDSSATLVQLTGGATNPIGTAACTVYDFEIVNHPSISVIDDLVAGFDPIHVVAGHGPRRTLRKFRGRYDERFVWASDDDREQTIYADGRWSPPPWLSETAVQSIRAQDWRSAGLRLDDVGDEGPKLPAVAPADEPDLEAEGIAVERFEDRYGGQTDDDLLVVDSTTESASTSSGADSALDSSATESVEIEPTTPDHPSAEGKEKTEDGSAATPEVREREDRIDEVEEFRAEVLDRLESLESTVADSGTPVRARVLDCEDSVTLLRVLGDVELDHGEEVEVVLAGDRE